MRVHLIERVVRDKKDSSGVRPEIYICVGVTYAHYMPDIWEVSEGWNSSTKWAIHLTVKPHGECMGDRRCWIGISCRLDM